MYSTGHRFEPPLAPDRVTGLGVPMRLRGNAFSAAERRSAASRDTPRDMFDMLADAFGDEDEGLLADEVSTMLFAGHETTGLTLFWACLLLANAPEWQDAVREEARSCDVSPSSVGEALARLPLTRAVAVET
ncbi:hypothetical protein MRF4_19160 [Methylobacterium radiotolerans]|uniref:Cytochrome P450 n=1 Tax=Methylobacterium oryzae TaxID=334852 RepID=A0ABU7TMR7_9HYPH